MSSDPVLIWRTQNALSCGDPYKASRAGGAVSPVDPRGTTIDCSGCGVEVPTGLAERVHRCPDCGLVLCRDWNAAINVLARAEFKAPGTGAVAPSGRVAA